MQIKNKNPENPKKRSSVATPARYADIAFRMAAMIALGTWLGTWLDGKIGMKTPTFVPILALLAIFGAIYMVIRETSKVHNE